MAPAWNEAKDIYCWQSFALPWNLKLLNSNSAWTNHPLQATQKTCFSVFEMESGSHHSIQTMKVNKPPSYFSYKNPLLDFNENWTNGIITAFALKISSICRNWIFQEDNHKADLLKCFSATNAGLQAPLQDKLNHSKDVKWFYFYSSGVSWYSFPDWILLTFIYLNHKKASLVLPLNRRTTAVRKGKEKNLEKGKPYGQMTFSFWFP